MSEKPEISVIIPIYNTEKYLKRCLDSVVAQTYTSYEVIMVDDGSKDDSESIARWYCADERFHYVRQTNSGVSVARNRGLCLAEGKWIAFVDSDDALREDYLGKLLQETDGACDIVCCCAEYLEEGDLKSIHFEVGDTIFIEESAISDTELVRVRRENDMSLLTYVVKGKKELYAQLMDSQYKASERRRTAIGVPWGKLYRTALLKENNLTFHPRLNRLQDNIFNMYAFEKARIIKYMDCPLYIYNLDHIKGFSSRYDPKAPEYYDLLFRLRRDFLEKHNFLRDSEMFRLHCQEIAEFTDSMLCQYYLNSENKLGIEIIVREMKERFKEPMYQEALREKDIRKSGIGKKVRLKLLEKKRYGMLLWLSRIVQVKRDVILSISNRGGYCKVNLSTLCFVENIEVSEVICYE